MGHRFTTPLLAEADGLPTYSDGYRLVAMVEQHVTHEGKPLRLDVWQQHLLIRILERCPPGHDREGQLRFTEAVISIPRQAGKSLLASVLALYGLLMHSTHPKVLGVAPTAKLAEHVYKYTKGYVNGSDAFAEALRTTNTRGIYKRDETGSYVVLAGDADKLQGYPSTVAIVDELHLVSEDIYDAIVASQFAQQNPLLVGITTAGDIRSTLLKRLYEQEKAGTESFGFFVYEASSNELTLEAIEEANPSVASGRIDGAKILDKAKSKPEAFWRRFILNRFIEGLAEPWVPVSAWANCAGRGLDDFKDCIYHFEVTNTWSYATITASKMVDGKTYQTLVARLVKPKPEHLLEWALRLRKAGRCSFSMNPNRLRSLTEALDAKGYTVLRIFGGRKAEAAGMVYAAIMRGDVQHDNQPFINSQHATAKIKSVGTDFEIVPGKGSEADAAYASVYGLYAAMTIKKKPMGKVA